jgi:hypothetical protein
MAMTAVGFLISYCMVLNLPDATITLFTASRPFSTTWLQIEPPVDDHHSLREISL